MIMCAKLMHVPRWEQLVNWDKEMIKCQPEHSEVQGIKVKLAKLFYFLGLGQKFKTTASILQAEMSLYTLSCLCVMEKYSKLYILL